MRYLSIFSLLLPLLGAGPVFAEGRTMIVLDGSGSMWGQVAGETKIEAARDVLRNVLARIPLDTELGLVAYGHRQENKCGDIEVAVPVGKGTAEQISNFADKLSPKGMTPLTDAVRIAAEQLNYTEEQTTVVLITDGIETCAADPCAAAELLEKQGTDLTVHVVGFGVTDEIGKKIACVAENTGGRYFTAADSQQLADALTETVAQVAEPSENKEVAKVENNLVCITRLADGSAPLAGNEAVQWEFFLLGEDGNPSEESAVRINDGVCETHLTPGRYLARATLGDIVVEQKIVASDDQSTEVEAIFNAGHVTVTAKKSAQDVQPMQDASIELTSRNGVRRGQGRVSAYVSAGPVVATGRTGDATIVENREIAAGQEIEIDLILGSGTLLPSAVFAEGRPTRDGDNVSYDLLVAEPDADGERAVMNVARKPNGEGIEVSPGRYFLRARLGQALATTPVFVKPGETMSATVNLNAGILHVNAPEAVRIEFLDAFGTKIYQESAGQDAEEIFNAGAYQVRVSYQSGAADKYIIATVQAGERTDVMVEYEPQIK